MFKEPEHWFMVPGSKKYQISNHGNFRKILKSGRTRPIKKYKKKTTWNVVKVDFHGKYGEYVVHTIMAEVFLDSPLPGQVIHHKNGLKLDDYAGNLEWITRQKLGKLAGGQSTSIPVLKINPETGKVINFYNSMTAAAKDNFISCESISRVIRGDSKTNITAGFLWKKETMNDELEWEEEMYL